MTGGRFRRNGTATPITDSLPFNPEEGDWKEGRRLAAVFPGDLHHCDRDGDDLKVFRRSSHGVDEKPVHVATFHGKHFEPATDEKNQLGIYELDPTSLPTVRSHDRRPFVTTFDGDHRMTEKERIRAVQKRNEEFWAKENAKLAERTNR